jgi:hypothetical protein
MLLSVWANMTRSAGLCAGRHAGLTRDMTPPGCCRGALNAGPSGISLLGTYVRARACRVGDRRFQEGALGMAKHLTQTRSLLMAAVIAAGLMGIGGTASAGAASSTNTAGSPPAAAVKNPAKLAPSPGSENPLGKIPENIKAIGTTAYSDIYGGLAVTQHGTHIDVYLTRADQRAEQQLAVGAPAGTVTFVSTPRSQKFLDSLHQKVTSQFSALKAAGIVLMEWAPEIGTGREMIGVAGLTPGRASVLDSRFGASNIELQNMPANQFTFTSTDRAYDAYPWNSGDFITDGGEGCTSGYGVRINGNPGLITADHCFAYDAGIKNYDNDCGCGSNSRMGYISQNDNTSDGTDTEVLDTQYQGGDSGLVYVGDPGTGTEEGVAGWADNPVGDTVCNSGAYSGTVCGIGIDNNNTCIYEPELGRDICHLIHGHTTSTIANELGDSGGPIFRYVNDDIYAIGTDVASTTADTIACQYNTRETCFTDIYYNAMDSVLAAYNATLITG